MTNISLIKAIRSAPNEVAALKILDAAQPQAVAAPAIPEGMTLPKRIAELAQQHGTLRAAARVIDIDAGYLSRLTSGEKVRPGKEFLRRMGLRAVTVYERTKP